MELIYVVSWGESLEFRPATNVRSACGHELEAMLSSIDRNGVLQKIQFIAANLAMWNSQVYGPDDNTHLLFATGCF
jgi:hypothetical protein